MHPEINNTKRAVPQKLPVMAIAFILPALYWLYLAFVSQMIIVHDSMGYQRLGSLLYTDGWIEYLKEGPAREPIYPFLISIAMRMADSFGISHQFILKIIQISILSVTQILIFCTLKKINVNNTITFMILLYFGFSPSIVNSALSTYSEVVCYPFLVGIILVNIYAWDALPMNNTPLGPCLWGFVLGMLFVFITSVKGVYEYIFLLFLIPYICLLLRSIIKKDRRLFLNAGLFLFLILFTFHACIISYKLLNKKYNGNYVFTSRSSPVLYNSAAIRAEKLTRKRLLTAIAYIPGETFCNSVFSQEKCAFWGTKNLESFQHTSEARALNSIVPEDKRHSAMMASIKEKILKNPSQFILLMGIDGIKLFFWESTRIGFVAYPDWLARIYDYFPLKIGLRVLMSCLSLFSFFFLVSVVFKNRNGLFCVRPGENKISARASILLHRKLPVSDANNPFPTYLFILLIISSHVGLYAFCAASVPRHALPLAPLYLLTVAFSIQRIKP